MRVSAIASAASSFHLSYLLPFSHSAPGYFILVAIEQAFNSSSASEGHKIPMDAK